MLGLGGIINQNNLKYSKSLMSSLTFLNFTIFRKFTELRFFTAMFRLIEIDTYRCAIEIFGYQFKLMNDYTCNSTLCNPFTSKI